MSRSIARVTSKGQVTIPKAIREKANISARDRLLFSLEGDRIIAIPLRSRPLAELYGALPATRPYPGHDQVRRAVRRGRGERLAGGKEG